MDGTCEWCGEQPGRLTTDPYAEEVYGEVVPVVACEACLDQRRDEI